VTRPAADNPGVRVHRSRVLHSSDVRIRQDLTVLSPARTLLDIAPQNATDAKTRTCGAPAWRRCA